MDCRCLTKIYFLDILKSMTSEYVNKLETVSNERRAFKHNVRKHKLVAVRSHGKCRLVYATYFS